jgi:rfaE bifunctional protein kinase chain/domain
MNVEEIFEQFTMKRVLVLGDVMVDAYLRGTVTRVSPEAPVPIINLEKSEERLGGAANVALNLVALGAEPVLCSIVGEDRGGDKFVELLQKRKLSTEGIIKSTNRQTTIKTRVIGNNQQLLRIDEEQSTVLNSSQEDALISRLKEVIQLQIDAVIIEDYNKGLLTPRVIDAIISLARKRNIIVAVDPKKDNFLEYKNVTLFKPNLKELKEGLNIDFDFPKERDQFESAVRKMEGIIQNGISFITLSEHGVFVKQGDKQDYLSAHVRNISDVSGAGDTVISVATLCLASGLNAKEVAEIANLSGGLVCELSGVVPIDKTQLIKEVQKLVMA